MREIEWVEPAPVWQRRALNLLSRPRIAEIESDDFLPNFIAGISGTQPHIYLDNTLFPAQSLEKLYQPLHGRFYLVTASLVCRRVGLPDKAVNLANGERVSFVVRRKIQGQGGDIEQGWDAELETWRDLLDEKGRPIRDTLGRPIGVMKTEDRFPMHPVTMCGDEIDDFRPMCSRKVYQGYIPTGNRDKYLTYTPYEPDDYFDAITDTETGSSQENFLLNEFDSKVIAVWYDYSKREGLIEDAKKSELAFYWVLDFSIVLRDTLRSVWNAIIANSSSSLSGDLLTLYNSLNDITVSRKLKSSNSSTVLSLPQLMREYQNKLDMAQGNPPAQGGNPLDTHDFLLEVVSINAVTGISGELNNLKDAVEAALEDETIEYQMPAEIAELLRTQVRVQPQEVNGDLAQYFIRLVYEYELGCPAVVSDESQPFRLAKHFDTDAPARKIRLELPSIKMGDLRKFKPGVGMQMTPELRDVMARVNEDMIEGEGLSGESISWELGMICTFSLQIIFLVAFIVMFIFLILLNIVFWWLPFLKICFPIPKPSSS